MTHADAGLSARVFARLAASVLPGQRATVAFSGGLDSTVLLALMAAHAQPLGLALRAAHIAHGLQAAAAAWPAHCAEVCVQLGVPFERIDVQVAPAGAGIEAAARTARYAALRALGGDWLALAHHRGDQAETVLHRLTRGAGVAGAAGMRYVDRRGAAPHLLRPLLNESRGELLAWAKAHGLRWIEDPSNTDTRFSRNFLRQDILPALAARFPGAEAALARAASHFAEAAELLDGLAQEDLAAVLCGNTASLTRLRTVSLPRLRNLLRARLAARDWPAPDAAQLEEAVRLIHEAQPPWRARFVHWALCAMDGAVWIEPAALPCLADARIWQGESDVDWGSVHLRFTPVSGLNALALIPGELRLQGRQGGERLQPDPRRPARDLKTLAREAGVPPWQREHLPVLWQGNRPVGYAGTMDHRLRAAPHAGGWQIEWTRTNPVF